MSHPAFTLLASALLAGVFAAVEDRTPRERGYVAVRVFLSCMVAVAGGAWVMLLIHG